MSLQPLYEATVSEKKKVRLAWFSEKQARACGTVFYERLEGGEVEVTMVSADGNHGCKWDDMKFVGEVLDFKRVGRSDPWPSSSMHYDDYYDVP